MTNIKNISVLMPAYNCGEYIFATIKSILNQTFKDFELVIINDGSTDNTEEIIDSITDGRIKYFKTENNGTSAALNLGLTKCKYEWVARIDADDLNVPSRLETQVTFLNENPDYDIISSWSVYFKDPAKILFLLKEPVNHSDIYDYFNLHNPLNQSGLMFRKNLIKQAGYNERFKSNEDFELLHRIRDEVKFYNIPQFLVYTRVRKGSRSHNSHNGDIYEMLFNPAFKKMIDAKSKGEHFYWASNIAWINYFYGMRQDSRSYFKNSFSWKNVLAYLTTFLPDEYFYKFINSRLKYRLKNIFVSTGKYKTELNSLLNSH